MRLAAIQGQIFKSGARVQADMTTRVALKTLVRLGLLERIGFGDYRLTGTKTDPTLKLRDWVRTRMAPKVGVCAKSLAKDYRIVHGVTLPDAMFAAELVAMAAEGQAIPLAKSKGWYVAAGYQAGDVDLETAAATQVDIFAE